MTGKRPQTVTVSIDDRARVPFAVIGVLMLVSSVMIVGVLQSRETPETEIDQTLAMDRTEAAVQNELRNVVVDATHRAAAQPVTTSDDLEDGSDDVFTNYLELLIYLGAQESLPNAGQSVDDVETTVELEGEVPDDPASAVEEADDVVDVTESTDDGTLEVSVDQVTITMERDGTVVNERTIDDLTVTVGTPIFELREQTEEYEDMLSQGFFEGDISELENLAHKTAVRLYPMAYFKSFINRMDSGDGDEDKGQGWTFEEVLDNDHTEVMTNDAIFGVQEEVFGEEAVDPYADRVMRPAWACFVADILETMAGEDDEEEENDEFEATVSVVDSSGSGIYNATVFLDGEEEGRTVPSNEVAFDLEENETHSIEVTVIDSGYERSEEEVTFSERNPQHTVELERPSDRTINVYGSDGKPLEGADVNIWTDDGLLYETTDDDGTVDLEALGVDTSSELTVEIFAENHTDYSETVEIDQSHSVILTSEDDVSLDGLENSAGLLSYFEDDPSVKETVCEDFREYLFGDKDGDLPDAPTLDELLTGMFGEMSPLTQNETIEPNDMADIAYYEMIGTEDLSTVLNDLPSSMNPKQIDEPIDYTADFDSEFGNGYFIDDMYTVDVDRSNTTSLESLPTNSTNSFENYTYNYSEYISEDVTVTRVRVTERWNATEGEYTNRDIYSLDVDFEIRVRERSVFENSTENGTDTRTIPRPTETVEGSVDIDIDADIVDDLHIEKSEIEDEFKPGEGYPERGNITGLSDPDNYEHIVIDSLETLLSVSSLDPDDSESLSTQIETDLNSSISVGSIPTSVADPEGHITSEVSSDVTGASSTSYDFDDLEGDSNLNESELRQWLKDDLYEVNAYVKKETERIEKPRIAFLRTPSPFAELGDAVEDVESELVQTNSYDNVPDLIRMRVRHEYFQTLTGRIDEMAEFHEDTVDDIDDAMSAGDGALDDSLDFIQEIFAGDVEEGTGDLEGSELMGDMEFEVSGSPTYMDLELVNDDEVPSVRPADSSRVMDNNVSGTHAALGAEYGQRLPTPGLPIIPWPPMLYVLQVNSYNVNIEGEYSRFEVSSTAGDPADGEATTYVRDRIDVEVDLGGGTPQKIGEVKPIEFDTSLEILIVMPGLMPMKSGAPPNAGDPSFGNEIGLSELLGALEDALDEEETATLVPKEGSTWYGETGPQ